MAKLIYSMIVSLDGYAVAAEGSLGRGAEDEEVHTFIGDAFRRVGTYLYAVSDRDLSVDGPDLARQAIATGLVDEYHLFGTTSETQQAHAPGDLRP